jgi:mRNA-degrading endonuclease RelE of RelBE toxin-antitoxin system
MNYKILSIPEFDRQLKRLSKKFHSLKNEIAELSIILQSNPGYGTPIGQHCFKVRLSIASKAKGKSGGARVITYLLVTENIVYLLSIYDKSEREDISNAELKQLLKQIR